MRADALRDAIAEDRAAGMHAARRRRDDRDDVDDERRSGARDRRRLRRATASGCTSTPRMPASTAMLPELPRALRRLGARRLDRRQPAQVAVHAVRSQRVLLPAHGRRARRRSRWCPNSCRTAEGARGVRNLMDTGIQLGRRFRALKLWMVLRHFGAEGIRAVLARAHAAGAAVRRVGRRRRRLRARGAGAVQRRLLPRAPAACSTPRPSSTTSTSACSTRSTRPARSSCRTRVSTAGSCCGSPSAICARRSSTSRARGRSCASIRAQLADVVTSINTL